MLSLSQTGKGCPAMRIRSGSRGERILTSHGVGLREIEATRIYVLNFQKGAAITLALPFLGPTILIKRAWLGLDENNELTDSWHMQMLCHELCHVRQMQEWGSLRYMARHLLARIKTRSVLAKSAPEERECYEVQERVAQHYRDRDSD